MSASVVNMLAVFERAATAAVGDAVLRAGSERKSALTRPLSEWLTGAASAVVFGMTAV